MSQQTPLWLFVAMAALLTLIAILAPKTASSDESKQDSRFYEAYVYAPVSVPEPVQAVIFEAPQAVVSPVPDQRGNVLLGEQIAAEKGVTGGQWECLYVLWGEKESGWNNHAQNPYSTAYGIAQFLDSTWAGTGYRKSSDPETQVRAGLVYVENRHGTPCAALSFRNANGSY